MVRPFAPAVMRVALAGALAATVMLSGCGRKGPLEAPPSAQVLEPTIDPATGKPRPVMSRTGHPIAPAGEKKPIALDWLIN